jgi:hypothetical protein
MRRVTRTGANMSAVHGLIGIRRAFARLGVRELARIIAVDSVPVWRHRSRRQHFRNGIGALLAVSSHLAWREPSVFIREAARRPLRREFRYAAWELRQAGRRRTGGSWLKATGLALLTLGATAAAASYFHTDSHTSRH